MTKSQTVSRAVALGATVAGSSGFLARRSPLLASGLVAVGVFAARAGFARNHRGFGPVITRGPDGAPRAALTFDDGPSPVTAKILDDLAAHDAKATFFVLGRQAERHPDLIRRMVDEGHQVANHGVDHGILMFRSTAYVREQLGRTQQIVREICGEMRMSRYCRAPHGFRGPFTAFGAWRAGYRMVGWTTGVFDSDDPGADVIATRTIAALKPGAVILLHDADGWAPDHHRDQTAQALPDVLAAARSHGIELVTLEGLLQGTA